MNSGSADWTVPGGTSHSVTIGAVGRKLLRQKQVSPFFRRAGPSRVRHSPREVHLGGSLDGPATQPGTGKPDGHSARSGQGDPVARCLPRRPS